MLFVLSISLISVSRSPLSESEGCAFPSIAASSRGQVSANPGLKDFYEGPNKGYFRPIFLAKES
jgi:hypothetical protein